MDCSKIQRHRHNVCSAVLGSRSDRSSENPRCARSNNCTAWVPVSRMPRSPVLPSPQANTNVEALLSDSITYKPFRSSFLFVLLSTTPSSCCCHSGCLVHATMLLPFRVVSSCNLFSTCCRGQVHHPVPLMFRAELHHVTRIAWCNQHGGTSYASSSPSVPLGQSINAISCCCHPGQHGGPLLCVKFAIPFLVFSLVKAEQQSNFRQKAAT